MPYNVLIVDDQAMPRQLFESFVASSERYALVASLDSAKVADFYCSGASLVIELDGSQHGEDAARIHDQKRTDYFESFGLQVLRFSNLDVMRNFRGVCEAIDLAVRQR